jgi:fucokinase
MSPWDYLIVTASNERQAEAYRSQLELRKKLGRIPQAKTILTVPDPGGIRVGSGGSTVACLMRVLELELPDGRGRTADPRAWRAALERLRILIIHAGGDSKRLPAYGPCGKIFVPVPAARGPEAPGHPVPAAIFDRLAPVYLSLPAPASGRGQTVISTGDVLLFFDPRRAAFARSGITALGCLASPEISRNHGVFIPNREGTIRRYLQKPSVAAQRESGAIAAGAGGRSILDMGIMSFDAEAAVRMLMLAGVREAHAGGRHRLAWSGPTARALEIWGLDIFREIACALGADTGFADYVEAARAAGSLWDEARLRRVYKDMHGLDFSLSLLPHCRFLHFGTSRELIRSGNALRRRDRTAAAGDSVVRLNNAFRERGRIAGKESWVEGCDIGAKLTLAGRNVVVGLDIDEPLALPRGAALDVLKGADRKGRAMWFVRPYAVVDIFHKPAEKGDRDVCDDQVGRLAGLALGEWLEAMGAHPEDVWDADVPPGDRQVWNGRFFPAAAHASSYRDWLWMLEPRTATGAEKRQWRRADRYSFAEMAVLADQDAFHARRRLG